LGLRSKCSIPIIRISCGLVKAALRQGEGMEERKKHAGERAKLIHKDLGLPDEILPHVTEHVHELISGKAPVIWIQGQACSGCSVSLMNSEHFRVQDLGFSKLSLRYQPDLMAAEGSDAARVIDEIEVEGSGRYLLVVEGSVPINDHGRFCTFGLKDSKHKLMQNQVHDDKTMLEWFAELVPGAAAAVMVGNCAAYGGIPSMNEGITGARGAADIIREMDEDKPIVNVAGCPPHPDWIMGTLIDTLLWLTGDKEKPELDDYGRLQRFYGTTIHDNCERRVAFDSKRFLEDWHELEPEENRCMIRLGCRGPRTQADCPTRRWNNATSWCVAVNSPCYGCTNPDYHLKLPHKPAYRQGSVQ
jgi:hydrogenase small subunit